MLQVYCLHRVVFFNGFSRCLQVYSCVLKHTHKKKTCIHVALYGGCGVATTAFICVFRTIKSSTKSNTIVSQSLMHKCYYYYYACLTTESMQQQQHQQFNRTCAPCAVFSINNRQIYTSLHSLNNNNKHTLSHSIFPMTPSLLSLPLQPSMPPPSLPLLHPSSPFTGNPLQWSLEWYVWATYTECMCSLVRFPHIECYVMFCFALLLPLCNCLTTIACGKLPPRVTQHNAVVKNMHFKLRFHRHFSPSNICIYISQFMLCRSLTHSLPLPVFSLMLLLFCTNVACQSFRT